MFNPSTNTIYQFHSNAFDGYPPDHTEYSNKNHVTGRINADMYRTTILKMHVLYEKSYNVTYLWEHEFRACEQHTNVLTLLHTYSTLLYPVQNRY